MNRCLVLFVMVVLPGCTNLKVSKGLVDENLVSRGYQPIDPLPIIVKTTNTITNARLLYALPNETMRLAIGEISTGGNIIYGPISTGIEGKSYVAVLDYIKYTTKSIGVIVKKSPDGTTELELFDYELFDSLKDPTARKEPDVMIPTYLGVGLRMIATFTVHKSNVKITSFYGLGAAAQDEQISGSLLIQTLGISGESVSPIIPMPSEINITTIQNAIQALATIKSKLYEEDNGKVSIVPHVVSIANHLGKEGKIEAFISQLLLSRQYMDLDKFERDLSR